MKIKDFIETLQDKNYCVEVAGNDDIYIRSSDGFVLAHISGECMGEFTIGVNIAIIEDMEERAWLVEHIACFATTPIDKRVESKKYYLKHKWLGLPDENFLNVDRDDLLFLSTKLYYGGCNTKFTEKEIESIKRKHNTDLKEFEIIEVD